MNKRKILSLTLGLCMVAILAVGGTLAYFTDTDAKTNTFTTGKVDITLNEVFATGELGNKLIPSTGSAQNGTLKNGIDKEITVTNNSGSEDAYVRVHIAIPTMLDDGDPTYNAMANTLHFNYEKESIGENKWDWSKTTGAEYEGDWNAYQATIDDIKYNVYVVTYGKVLAAGETTAEKAMHQVYLDSKVTNEQIASINEVLGTNWKIEVVAEGAQAEGFADAYAALNTAFGVPGSYNPWEKAE